MKPLHIVVDTREQLPYEFPSAGVTTVRRALAAGDYSLAGRESEFAVERKSLADFVQTVIRSRERFHKELTKLKHYRRACVVIEGSMTDITQARYPGGAHPSSVLGALVSIIVDFGIPVYLCGDRCHACRFVEDYLRRCERLAPRPGLEPWGGEDPTPCEDSSYENHALPSDPSAGDPDRDPVSGDHATELISSDGALRRRRAAK